MALVAAKNAAASAASALAQHHHHPGRREQHRQQQVHRGPFPEEVEQHDGGEHREQVVDDPRLPRVDVGQGVEVQHHHQPSGDAAGDEQPVVAGRMETWRDPEDHQADQDPHQEPQHRQVSRAEPHARPAQHASQHRHQPEAKRRPDQGGPGQHGVGGSRSVGRRHRAIRPRMDENFTDPLKNTGGHLAPLVKSRYAHK